MARNHLAGLGAAIVVALALALPGASPAATLSYANGGAEVVYTAAAGETNDLTVTFDDQFDSGGPTFAILTDPGATFPAPLPRRCEARDPHTVACELEGREVAVALGDGDDRVTVDGFLEDLTTTIDGGDGNDTVSGSRFPDVLTGGAGDDAIDARGGVDTLTGGPGVDRLAGGPSSDVLVDGGALAERDTFDGGTGSDRLSYRGTAGPLRLDLAKRATAAADDATGIEGLIGSDGDDRITGTDGPDRIDGGAGSDTIRGGRGDDVLAAGRDARSTRDRLLGEDGDDELDLDRGTGTAECGRGIDTVVEPGAKTPLDYFCDQAAFRLEGGRLRLGPSPYEQERTRVLFKLRCGYNGANFGPAPRCGDTLVLRAAGTRTVLGRVAVRGKADGQSLYSRWMTLTPAGRRLIARRQGGLVDAVFQTTYGVARWRFRLKLEY